MPAKTTPAKTAKKTAKKTSYFYLLLDRSGSMQSIRTDVVGGVNSFIEEQQGVKVDEMKFTLVQFDSIAAFEVVQDNVPVAKAKPLTVETYAPRGQTPLLDAVGKLFTKIKAEVPKRGKQGVVVAIVTDGRENASMEYDRASVEALVEEAEGKGWTIAFIGANVDSFSELGGIGSTRGSSMDFKATPAGTAGAFATLSVSNLSYRTARANGQTIQSADYLNQQ